MSTEVVSWAERLQKEAREVAATEAMTVQGMSFRGGVVSMNGVPVPGNSMDVMIVGYVFENRWFKDRFDPDKKVDPTCFSQSLTGEGMVPHDLSGEKQGDACDYGRCPKFEWKSDPVTQKGKACKEIRKLVMIPGNALKEGADGVSKAEMAVATIPVTSVRNWSAFVNRVAAEYQLPPWAVLCKISCAPHPKKQLEITFEPIAGVTNDDLLGALDRKRQEAVKIAMQPYENSGGEPAAAASTPAPKTGKKY